MKTDWMLDMLSRVEEMAESLDMHEVQSHIWSAKRAINMALKRNAEQQRKTTDVRT